MVLLWKTTTQRRRLRSHPSQLEIFLSLPMPCPLHTQIPRPRLCSSSPPLLQTPPPPTSQWLASYNTSTPRHPPCTRRTRFTRTSRAPHRLSRQLNHRSIIPLTHFITFHRLSRQRRCRCDRRPHRHRLCHRPALTCLHFCLSTPSPLTANTPLPLTWALGCGSPPPPATDLWCTSMAPPPHSRSTLSPPLQPLNQAPYRPLPISPPLPIRHPHCHPPRSPRRQQRPLRCHTHRHSSPPRRLLGRHPPLQPAHPLPPSSPKPPPSSASPPLASALYVMPMATTTTSSPPSPLPLPHTPAPRLRPLPNASRCGPTPPK